jgi:asparagine synthase (glutamine-hydrolysing)
MPRQLVRADRLLRALHLERLFLGRHKFYHFRIWYRDELRDYVRDVLLDPRSLTRPYISKKEVEKAVKAHIGGEANHTLAIHRLLTLELTQRRLIEGWA